MQHGTSATTVLGFALMFLLHAAKLWALADVMSVLGAVWLELSCSGNCSRSAQAKEREDIQAGKRPFFLKASEKRKQALIQRYHELKASGKLEKAMAKRRKKMASKDHRLVPRGRRMVE